MSGGESVDRLRQAAARVRALAEAATPGRWESLDNGDRIVAWGGDMDPFGERPDTFAYIVPEPTDNPADATYIAAMHPAVAVAVADWLEGTADTPAFTAFAEGRSGSHVGKNIRAALAVADAFLGSS